MIIITFPFKSRISVELLPEKISSQSLQITIDKVNIERLDSFLHIDSGITQNFTDEQVYCGQNLDQFCEADIAST